MQAETGRWPRCSVFEYISDAVLALDSDGRLTYVNPPMERLIARPRAAILGLDLADVWSEAAAAPLQQAIAAARSANGGGICVAVPPGGARYELHADASDAGITVVMREVQAGAAAPSETPIGGLSDSQDLQDDVAQAGTWRIDAPGRQIFWSRENYRIFGIPEGSSLSYEAFLATIRPGDSAPQRTEPSWHAGPRGAVTETERSIVAGGKTKWVRERAWLEFNEQGRLTRGFGSTLDITAHKLAEQQLAQSRARFENVVESAMDAIVVVDAGHRIVLFNSAAEVMFRCPSIKAIGQPLSMFIPERFRDAHAGHIRSFAASGTTRRSMGRLGVLRGLRGDGTEFPIEVSISQTGTGGRYDFTAIIRDISERVRGEERQRQLSAELDHRVKNMLANIGAIVSLSSRGANSVTEFAEALKQRLLALGTAHNLLQKGRWRGLHLAELCNQVLAPYRSEGGNFRLEGEPLMVTSKAARPIALALHELATNAIKYGALSAPGGQVAISWWRKPQNAGPDYLYLIWRESGGPAVARPSRKGFGSSVLQNMVALELNGVVNYNFELDGLLWSLEAPVIHAPEVESVPEVAWLSRTGRPPEAASQRILIVEDEGPVALELKAIIEKHGHTVFGPAAGLDFAASLAESAELDAALLDIQLVEGDVSPLAQRLIERKVPVAMLTGSDPIGLPEKLRALPILTKPYSEAEVVAIISQLCEQRAKPAQ